MSEKRFALLKESHQSSLKEGETPSLKEDSLGKICVLKNHFDFISVILSI